jgi:hypothetical protein|tara:strand:+ start:1296 stop:1673 length:378 start_codon:yes stop_codon:yes gene_type:complete
MALKCQAEIAKIIEKEKRWDEYYIIVRAYHDKEESFRTGLMVIRTKLMITPKRPEVSWVGTFVVHVRTWEATEKEWDKGLTSYLHNLPADKPTDAALEFSDEGSEAVAESAKRNNSPIVWAESNN